jgi:O-succinylbenzoic acid--CoA ligase
MVPVVTSPPRTWSLVPEPCPAGFPGPWLWLLPGVGAALDWLRAAGLERGARAGLAGLNTPATAALLLAAPLAGVTLVLLNRRLAPGELAAQVAQARIRAVLAAPGHPLATHPAARLLPESFPAGPARTPPTPLADGDAALVLFTSGTTGAARAARLDLAALRHAGAAAVAHLGLGPAERWLACLPLDHIGGASMVTRAALSGCALLLVERFAAEAVAEALAAHAITGLSVVPTMLRRLVDAQAGRPWPVTLRTILTGGGPLDAALIAHCTALGVAPCQTYGLTEAASQVCTLRPEEAAAHPGSAGRALPGMALRVQGAHGAAAAPGTVGEILVRGPGLFSGYEDAAGALTTPFADGWFATGDLGELDSGGFLTVHCRRTDLILSGGENLYPAEIEGVLATHPGLADAAVVPSPDPEWGQVPTALLVARAAPLPAAELATWIAARLPGFKRPRRWTWVASLPRTATGKLQRFRLKATP